MIHRGDALNVLKTFEPESIDCCVTSPPYWALRDYKVEGQLGLEPTFQEYIDKLCIIFDEVKRVLRPTGACWVVLGDTYGRGDRTTNCKQTVERNENRHLGINNKTGYSKSLCMIPERFAIEMIRRGWILRNKIVWHKPNCMPSSAKDRFTVDYENVFFFVKSQRYYFETQYEPLITEPHAPGHTTALKNIDAFANSHTKRDLEYEQKHPDRVWGNSSGRIKRCVWRISTKPFSGAHFAVFPPELIETPIKATCPEYVCTKCGKARERLEKFTGQYKDFERWGALGTDPKGRCDTYGLSNTSGLRTGKQKIYESNGLSDCGCGAPFESGICLDPFMGAGTTGLVALKLARQFVGIELNPSYIELANKRLEPFVAQTRL